MGDHPGATHLEDQELTQLLALRLQRLLELLETVLAKRSVRRPVGLVEGSPGGVNGAAHVRLRSVRDLTQHLLGGRVDVRERPRLAVDESAVDEHPGLEPSRTCSGHRDPSSGGQPFLGAQRPPSAGGLTSGRPDWPDCQPAQMPGKYGPGCPAFS